MPKYKIINGVKIAIDELVKIWVNDGLVAEIVSNPEDLEDLGIGYAYSEGYAANIDDIIEVSVLQNQVRIKTRLNASRAARLLDDCGVGELVKALRGDPADAALMVKLAGEFTKMTIWHVDPHLAMHTSALYVDGDWLVVHDTSRHSGVIKLVGKFLKRGGGKLKIAYTTGRVSSDMVYRLATIGVNGIVSLRGPLYSGVEAACRLGITLVSNVRNAGFTTLCTPRDFEKISNNS
ncbi:formate dehydrogenase delta subunit [Pyrobaculum aerophilum str. IM2]|uniref:Formate dehydrogenase delta subunit n=2 Tax=Pyrobaculum aerophilum TaxID=13773 RepID=Q8ZUQ5_PYRAE|nr:formate dehydrogenase accessory sulfurtransferase FdhD [Pyrobaculum aerophilum]AAL64351.1 formate dehydrogenase delta subunit [Pyrobaculum aerophilum str. IM2]HII47967.1 formate dehydrogenase accessory sulfurtransferase FdhD [Pyrobaculum aerophilum]